MARWNEPLGASDWSVQQIKVTESSRHAVNDASVEGTNRFAFPFNP
jgi:hypothetical protein